MKIDTSSWKEFKIGDLFKIKRPKYRSFSKYEYGDVPFVASGEFNNGIVGYVKPKKNESLDLGNCITVSPVDGRSLYQPKDFLGRGGGGSSIILLYSDELNEYNGLYLVSIITKALQHHEFKDMASGKSIISNKILLPCKNNSPDWEYMEDFMKKMEMKAKKNLNNLLSI